MPLRAWTRGEARLRQCVKPPPLPEHSPPCPNRTHSQSLTLIPHQRRKITIIIVNQNHPPENKPRTPAKHQPEALQKKTAAPHFFRHRTLKYHNRPANSPKKPREIRRFLTKKHKKNLDFTYVPCDFASPRSWASIFFHFLIIFLAPGPIMGFDSNVICARIICQLCLFHFLHWKLERRPSVKTSS